MRKEDFDLIEQELEITLPESYKKAAMEARISKTRHPSKFYDDPHKVISTNKRLREKGIYGKMLKKEHFVFGYQRHGGVYYFINTKSNDGFVYEADRTKTWQYMPDDISNNKSPYGKIDEFVNNVCFWNERVENSEKNPPPELTDEEKAKMVAEFFRERETKFPRSSQ